MPLNNFTLLFVEDSIETQEHMKMILEDEVKEFYQAYDGADGFEVFKRKKPDIVLTDINMPHLNGLELTGKIKEIDSDIPVIVMSGHDDREHLLSSINIGSDGFITKPINIEILLEKLNDIAQKLEEKRVHKDSTQQQLEKLYKIAHYDTLTNIPNKLMFDIELIKSIEDAKIHNDNLAIFFIDLDHFKAVNDTYGHDAGDFVLKSVVKNISQFISSDMMFARRSGDEFLVLIKGYKDDDYLRTLASNILKASSKTLSWKGEDLLLSSSIGISRYAHDALEHEELINIADKAMYNVKDKGKGDFSFI